MRNLKIVLMLIFINIIFINIYVYGSGNRFLPFDLKKSKTIKISKWKKITTNPVNMFVNSAIRFFQKRLSPLDGDNCQFYPTCSEYARLSFKKYGFIKGWILSSDRLLRCNHMNVKIYPFAKGRHRWRRYDPVP